MPRQRFKYQFIRCLSISFAIFNKATEDNSRLPTDFTGLKSSQCILRKIGSKAGCFLREYDEGLLHPELCVNIRLRLKKGSELLECIFREGAAEVSPLVIRGGRSGVNQIAKLIYEAIIRFGFSK